MKTQKKYFIGVFIIIILFLLFKNDFQLWKLFGSEKQRTMHTKGKLCTYSTRYFMNFEVSRDTTCVATNN